MDYLYPGGSFRTKLATCCPLVIYLELNYGNYNLIDKKIHAIDVLADLGAALC